MTVNNPIPAPSMPDYVRAECVQLLEQALDRLRHPSENAHGKTLQAGGAYRRLVTVLKHLDAHLDHYEGEHANAIRETHGHLTRAEP